MKNKRLAIGITLGLAMFTFVLGGCSQGQNTASTSKPVVTETQKPETSKPESSASETVKQEPTPSQAPQETVPPAPTGEVKAGGEVLLKVGDKGKAVLELQKKLFNIGNTLTVDGNFGTGTKKIIEAIQAKYSIEKTGSYTIATEKVLADIKDVRNYDTIRAEEQKAVANLPLQERIKSYLGTGVSRVGFIYYDLTSGEKIAINENKVCVAASTYKVGMNMVAYDKVRAGSLDLEEGLKYDSSMFEGGTGVLQSQVNTTLKSPVKVQKLLDLAITHSDNIATNMISRRLGGTQAVRKAVLKMTGITNVDVVNNRTTPEVQFRLLKQLYENRSDKYNAHLIEVMKQTVFHDRIDKYVPKNLVAHKIGNYGSYTNDIGIVFTDKPYIFVMYVDGLSDSAEKIAQVSKMVYEAQLKK
jgi:beta-lactamase class A